MLIDLINYLKEKTFRTREEAENGPISISLHLKIQIFQFTVRKLAKKFSVLISNISEHIWQLKKI